MDRERLLRDADLLLDLLAPSLTGDLDLLKDRLRFGSGDSDLVLDLDLTWADGLVLRRGDRDLEMCFETGRDRDRDLLLASPLRPPRLDGMYVSMSRLSGRALRGDSWRRGGGDREYLGGLDSYGRPPRPPPRPRPRSLLSRCRMFSKLRSRVPSCSLRRRASSAIFSASTYNHELSRSCNQF